MLLFSARAVINAPVSTTGSRLIKNQFTLAVDFDYDGITPS